MRKIQAQPITPDSWILQEWGNRIGVLAQDSHTWHLILTNEKLLNSSLDHIQTHLNAQLEFVQPMSDSELTASDAVQIEGLPIKHDQAHNIELQPRISYTRTAKGSSRLAAGYWCIQFDTGWSGALCPKCDTLDTYVHEGPFSHKLEMITILNKLRKESS